MIDFHCHLDLYRHPAVAVEDADKAGVYVLFVTTTPRAWPGARVMARGRQRIRVALGLHPELSRERLNELPLFEEFGNETKYFGEIGLDGSPQFREFQKEQVKVFRTILDAATNMGGKILSIHSRRATEQVLNTLVTYPSAGIPILHWFSGSKSQLRRAVELGCWFSCGPAMLRFAKGRAIAKEIPRGRMLTETDGPFAFLGSRPLQPADSWLAVESLREIWDIEREEAVSILRGNLRKVSSMAQVR